MTDKDIKVILEYEVVEDIMRCMNEMSEHDKSGEYSLECDNGQKLTILFRWEKY